MNPPPFRRPPAAADDDSSFDGELAEHRRAFTSITIPRVRPRADVRRAFVVLGVDARLK